MAKLFGELCPACGGDGRAGLYQGVGPHGQDCPYCFAFREVYIIGQVPKTATTLPNEHTGERWFHVFDRQTKAATSERRPFRLTVRRPPSNPIERPRRRTEPMPSQRGGVVRHWTTGAIWSRLRTGPVTKQRRYHQQVEFIKAYPVLRSDLRRRENAVFCFTIIAWIVASLGVIVLVSAVIIALLYGKINP